MAEDFGDSMGIYDWYPHSFELSISKKDLVELFSRWELEDFQERHAVWQANKEFSDSNGPSVNVTRLLAKCGKCGSYIEKKKTPKGLNYHRTQSEKRLGRSFAEYYYEKDGARKNCGQQPLSKSCHSRESLSTYEIVHGPHTPAAAAAVEAQRTAVSEKQRPTSIEIQGRRQRRLNRKRPQWIRKLIGTEFEDDALHMFWQFKQAKEDMVSALGLPFSMFVTNEDHTRIVNEVLAKSLAEFKSTTRTKQFEEIRNVSKFPQWINKLTDAGWKNGEVLSMHEALVEKWVQIEWLKLAQPITRVACSALLRDLKIVREVREEMKMQEEMNHLMILQLKSTIEQREKDQLERDALHQQLRLKHEYTTAKLELERESARLEKLRLDRSESKARKEVAALKKENLELKMKIHDFQCAKYINTDAVCWQDICRLPDISPMYTVYNLKPLAQGSPSYLFLENHIRQNLECHRYSYQDPMICQQPRIIIQGVAEVINKRLSQQYVSAGQDNVRSRMRAASHNHQTMRDLPKELQKFAVPDSDINECLLFHGATTDTCDKITKEGFDPSRGGNKSGKLFGQGTYFTGIFSKADQYTDQDFQQRAQTKTAEREVLVVRVIVGSAFHALLPNPDLTAPPRCGLTDAVIYDSVYGECRNMGGSVDFPEVVIFDRTYLYPMYLVRYQHHADCGCQFCNAICNSCGKSHCFTHS